MFSESTFLRLAGRVSSLDMVADRSRTTNVIGVGRERKAEGLRGVTILKERKGRARPHPVLAWRVCIE
jgi:hypothetical protein